MPDNLPPNEDNLDPSLRDQIDAETKGLRENRDKVLAEKRAEREARLKAEEERDKLREVMDAVGGTEGLQKLLAEKDSAAILEQLKEDPQGIKDQLTREVREAEGRKLAKSEERAKALEDELQRSKARIADMTKASHLREKMGDLVKEGLLAFAIDAISAQLIVNEEGVIETQDGVTADEVIESFLDKHPDFKRPSSGAGALGGSGRKRGMSRADLLKLSPAEAMGKVTPK